ncbi:MAG: response regulator [Rubripirellula sp.]|nr:response regulator [Rubripirellula sp.]
MSDEPTVFIVDDDEGARNSVRALVRSMGVEVETFSSAESFLEELDPASFGCLVTDVRMLGMSGIELQEKMVAEGVKLPVIIITAHAETALTVRAVKQGAVTVLEKPCRDYELYDAIRAALNQDVENRDKIREQLLFLEKLNTLSDQERVVMGLMVEGLANKVIARRINVSVRTVENRRQRIFEKTETDSLAKLIRMVIESDRS